MRHTGKHTTYGGNGFTIVELLIVVVVIAILAAIITVSYRGITQKAEVVRYAAAADSIKKQLMTAAITHDLKGLFRTNADPFQRYCWGTATDYPQAPSFDASACAYEVGHGFRTVNQPLHDQLVTMKAITPSSSTKGLSTATLSSNRYRGIIYEYVPSGESVILSWYTAQKEGCGGSVGSAPISENHDFDELRDMYSQALSILQKAQAGVITYDEASSQLGWGSQSVDATNVAQLIDQITQTLEVYNSSTWSCSVVVEL